MLPNNASGKLKRVNIDGQGIGQRIEIHTVQPDEVKVISNWLRFHKQVLITDETGEAKVCQVAIAFQLESQLDDSESVQAEEKKGKRKPTKTKSEWRIVPCEPGQVSIFFPAEKETSNLRFHLHAPFASTVARDSVRDCDSNNKLRNALGQLTAEALLDMRDRGLLTTSFLAVLPNEDDGLPEFYRPIREAIVKAFRTQNLVPTKSGDYRPAESLYRGPVEISSLIEDGDLPLLADSGPRLWAVNAPQKGQREDKFLDSLQIEEWEWYTLKDAIQAATEDDEKRLRIESWISKKPDNWLMRFYAVMDTCHQKTAWTHDPSPLLPAWQILNGVRVVDGKGAQKHTRPAEVYFPEQVSNAGVHTVFDLPASIWRVKPEVYKEGRAEGVMIAARDFLERVGVRVYDKRAEIMRRLEGYLKPRKETIFESHVRDIRSFIAFLRENPSELRIFEGFKFVLAIDGAQNQSWTVPETVFLDAPFTETGLAELTEAHHKSRLSDHYSECFKNESERSDFTAFLKRLGAFHKPSVVLKANILFRQHKSNRIRLRIFCVLQQFINEMGVVRIDICQEIGNTLLKSILPVRFDPL